MKMIAFYPSSGGNRPAEPKEIVADDRDKVLEQAQYACPPGHYLSRLSDGGGTVWEEGSGWVKD